MKRDNVVPVLILLTAFLLRFIGLGLRPPHFDEGINGWFVDQMWSHGYFKYDPTNYHGPLHFYALQLFEILFGRNLVALRLVTATVSTVTVYYTLKHREFMGRAAIWAALFMTISPAMVFMGRYAIHESWIPLCLVVMNYGFMRWFQKGDTISLIYFFSGIAGSLMVKETAVIHLGAWALAFGYLWFSQKQKVASAHFETIPVFDSQKLPSTEDIILGCTWILVALFVVYSGFGIYAHGFIDFFNALLPWLKTGTEGAGHEKSFWYWFQLIFEYEFYGILACASVLFINSKKSGWLRYFFINAFFTMLVYSIVKYKTPWCAASIFTFFPFLAGYAVEWGVTNGKKKITYVAAVAIACAAFVQTISLNFINYASPKEKYVYVHTTPDYFKIVDPIFHLLKDHPEKKNMRIDMKLESSWPLAWTLGQFPNISYAIDNDLTNLDFAIVDAKELPNIEPKLRGKYYKIKIVLREYLADTYAYFKKETFEGYTSGEVISPEKNFK